MIRKSLKKPLILVLIVFLSLQAQTLNVNAQTIDDTQISNNVWKLTQWNSKADVLWYSKGLYIHATPNTNVTYDVTKAYNNATDPNSGTFSIGNVTNVQTDNYDLANTFALSVYPWAPGFVVNPNNWTYYQQQAKDAANAMPGTMKISQGIGNATNLYRVTYIFQFNQTSGGNQNSTLVYDRFTGVLIYAYSEFNFSTLYKIELQLTSSTLITASNNNVAPGFTFLIPIVLFVPLALLKRKKFIKK